MVSNQLIDRGFEVLRENLGDVEMERFISLIIKEPFNYTEWRKENLFKGMSLEEIHNEGVALFNEVYMR